MQPSRIPLTSLRGAIPSSHATKQPRPTTIRGAARAPIPSGRALALCALSLASGVIGLSSDFVDTVTTPLGVFSGPLLMFVRLAFVKSEPVLAATGVLLLGSAIVLAGSRTLDQILHPKEGAVSVKPGGGPRI